MPHTARRQDGVPTRLARAASALAFVGAVWLLPEGDTWWLGAVAAVGVAAWLSRGRLGAPGGVWLGLAVFAGAVPWAGLPYRRGLLLAVLGAGVLLAWAVAGWRYRRGVNLPTRGGPGSARPDTMPPGDQ